MYDIIYLSGESYPENPILFYHSIMEWVNQKIEQEEMVEMVFSLTYLNTKSLKMISDIFSSLNKYDLMHPNKVNITWFHDENDIDVKDIAENFFSEMSFAYEIKKNEETND